MIKQLKFKFGPVDFDNKLEVQPTPITIFVGPNNSGKSRALIEIENFCRSGKQNNNSLIFEKILYEPYREEDFISELEKIIVEPNINDNIKEGDIVISKLKAQTNQVNRFITAKNNLVLEATGSGTSMYIIPKYPLYVDLYTLRLDGTNRLNLLSEKEAGDLQKTPQNNLSQLFQRDDLRKNLRSIVYEAFKKYFVIDPTNVGKLRARLSETKPLSDEIERGWGAASVKFHGEALPIENASDGVKAFCGILSTIVAGDPKVLLIDEPEAFLHPSLSTLLAKEIGKSLNSSNKKLFAATHSSSFLMGCIQANTPLNIVRLTYRNNNPTCRILPKEKIIHLMRHPLLRSTGVLNGLFYEAVVVTESDSDRAFYQEINERLLNEGDKRGIQNCLFLNAQNKQTVWDIVKPLRELGIPTVGIVDIDVFKEGGTVFTKLLVNSFIPTLNHESFHRQRKAIYDEFEKTNKNWKIQGGITLLGKNEQEALNNFINQLKDYGVFIVKNGELESWLKFLNASGHGSNWLINIFEKMGENPSDISYIKPTDKDVWNFISEINEWISNEKRSGIPE
ncbi:MAG TPA: ATP-binding protein [Flavobacterium sp.]|nr:ATP-binding protein [Flavobacterium sp.]